MRKAIFQPLFQTADGFGLIAGRTECGVQLEWFAHISGPEDGIDQQVFNSTLQFHFCQ